MAAWTLERVARIKYDPSLDPGNRGDHTVWEGSGGFGVRLYRSGRKTWVQTGSRWSEARAKWVSYIATLGVVGEMDLKDARSAAEAARREGLQEDVGLARTSLQQAVDFYLAQRDCAPGSKRDLASVMRSSAGDLLSRPLLQITPTQLRARYDAILREQAAREQARTKALEAMSPEQRLLHPPPGYFTGRKQGHALVEAVQRVYLYWVRHHAGELQAAKVLVPPCPAIAIREDLLPQEQRVKSVPLADLGKLLASLESYPGNLLHPPLVRLLLATGSRVGVLLGACWEWVQDDRIVIPADAEQGKVRWRKRHLAHMAKHLPRTAQVNAVLDTLRKLMPLYGELGKVWLFPSRESKCGHLVEEKSMVRQLRKHAGVRFSPHQLRHVVATMAEECGYAKSEIAELLGHGQQDVTARYVDDQLKRHHKMLTEIDAKIAASCRRP